MTKANTFYSIMAFYAILTYLVLPYVFYQYKNTLESAGNGFVVGSVISVILWVTYGSRMVIS
jgi:branched-subunit amino acid transport protein